MKVPRRSFHHEMVTLNYHKLQPITLKLRVEKERRRRKRKWGKILHVILLFTQCKIVCCCTAVIAKAFSILKLFVTHFFYPFIVTFMSCEFELCKATKNSSSKLRNHSNDQQSKKRFSSLHSNHILAAKRAQKIEINNFFDL